MISSLLIAELQTWRLLLFVNNLVLVLSLLSSISHCLDCALRPTRMLLSASLGLRLCGTGRTSISSIRQQTRYAKYCFSSKGRTIRHFKSIKLKSCRQPRKANTVLSACSSTEAKSFEIVNKKIGVRFSSIVLGLALWKQTSSTTCFMAETADTLVREGVKESESETCAHAAALSGEINDTSVETLQLKDVARVIELIFIFSPTIILAPLLVWREDTRELLNTIFVWCIQKAGPTFIKLGQWASTRPDIFPPETCKTLRVLHSKVKSEPFSKVKRMIEDTIGLPIDEIFVDFDRDPIGCGCVAQVYRAKMQLNKHDKIGQEVAVKVMRHGIRGAFEQDLRLIQIFVNGLRKTFPWLKWLECTEAMELFADHMTAQLDLRVEGDNLSRLRSNFGVLSDTDAASKGAINQVVFPKPIFSYENVLIQTFERGIPVLDVLDEETGSAMQSKYKPKIDKLKLANMGVNAFLKMVLIDNFVHGDLHPGNILVRHHGNDTKSDSVQLVFLDAGLVVQLTERDRKNFLQVFKAVAERNGRLVGKLMLEQAKYENCPDHEKFIAGMEEIVNVVDTFNLGEIDIGTVLRNVLNLVRENQVQVDSSFTTLVLSIVLLEGLGRQLNPDLDIFKAALPMLIELQLGRIF